MGKHGVEFFASSILLLKAIYSESLKLRQPGIPLHEHVLYFAGKFDILWEFVKL